MDSPLQFWTWLFFAIYTGIMLVCGVVGMRRIRDSDDFATARNSYGPLFLALAMTATTASGGTFLGLPGILYTWGLSGIWFTTVYPIGVYLGVLLCMKAVSQTGRAMGSRSIPEFLGDRYQSDTLRVMVSLFSLMLLFYLAGQLLGGIVMFQTMLGVSPLWALGISTIILLIYVVIGGAHADILTDGLQGALMLILSVTIGILFLCGYGVEGGFTGMLAAIEKLDTKTVQPLNESSPILNSWWAIFSLLMAHVPLGLLPHIGNKLWALKDGASRMKFISLAFLFGLLLPLIGWGGILCRAIVGDEILSTDNRAIPILFAQIFPPWLAAMAGAGILAAVMSTADGLVVSSSQIFANDIYRLTYAPRHHAHLSAEQIDRISLTISRVATVGVLLAALALAWKLQDRNIALLIWIGIGGMMAALAGPMILGILWPGVTRWGALAGFLTGAVVFAVLKAGVISTSSFGEGHLNEIAAWLGSQHDNPYACATLGEFASLAVTVVVSWFSSSGPVATDGSLSCTDRAPLDS